MSSSDPDPTVVHVSRLGWCCLGLVLLLPWVAVFWLLRSAPPGQRTPVPALATTSPLSAVEAKSNIQQGQPGPWGQLEYTRILIEPPDDFILPSLAAHRPLRWAFQGHSETSLNSLWQAAGLTEAQREQLNDPHFREVVGDAIIIRPPTDLVMGLSKAARDKLYSVLAATPDNPPQNDPYRIHFSRVDEWFDDSGLPADIVDLTRRLLYRRGENMVFSDRDLVLPLLASPEERSHFVKTLSRCSALLVQLRVEPGADIAGLERYWGHGRRSKDVEPLLKSLANRPGGGVIDIVHLIPQFARALLYTYPVPSERSDADAHDCHWSSLNFYNLIPDERFLNLDFVLQSYKNDYYRVGGKPTLGDIILLVAPGDRGVHSCVYIADGIVFTKNGPASSVPWVLSRLENVVAFYTLIEPLEVRYYRARRL